MRNSNERATDTYRRFRRLAVGFQRVDAGDCDPNDTAERPSSRPTLGLAAAILLGLPPLLMMVPSWVEPRRQPGPR